MSRNWRLKRYAWLSLTTSPSLTSVVKWPCTVVSQAARKAGADWLVYEHDFPSNPTISIERGAEALSLLEFRSDIYLANNGVRHCSQRQSPQTLQMTR